MIAVIPAELDQGLAKEYIKSLWHASVHHTIKSTIKSTLIDRIILTIIKTRNCDKCKYFKQVEIIS